ncbi:MAG: HDOD domain-containing protein [Phycisphaerales bacterium]
MAAITPQDRARHVEIILGRIDALPTLSPVAVRVLQLSSDSRAGLDELTRLIGSDPALTAKVLALTRRSDLGIARGITSIDRVVILLGLDTLRAALLSAELYEMFKPGGTGDAAHAADSHDNPSAEDRDACFDASGFWRHSIAVACAAELIAEKFRGALPGVQPGEAYLCGLLHDLGKPALERTLPRTYARVVALSQDGRAALAEVEKRVMGVDHLTAGKRLAERWGLPHAVVDTMWLHAKPFDALPDLPHRTMIALVGVADAFCRSRHIGFSGNLAALDQLPRLCAELGLDEERVREIEQPLIARVAERCAALGLEEVTDKEVLLEALSQANRRLAAFTARAAAAPQLTAAGTASERLTVALAGFLAEQRRRPAPGGTGAVDAVAELIAHSAMQWLGSECVALIWQPRANAACEGYEFCAQHGWATVRQRTRFEAIPPTHPQTTWTIADPTGAGTLVILHDRTEGTPPPLPPTLSDLWLLTIQSAAKHEGATRVAEQLVESLDRVAKAEETASRAQVMASLGELAAGAAHEMNNPLAVISGNAQLLAKSLKNPNDYRAMAAIVKASGRLADLVQSLHLFASPSQPNRVETDMNELVARACRDARERCGMPNAHGSRHASPALSIRANVDPQTRFARVDPGQVSQALVELITNAIESEPRSVIELKIAVDGNFDHLLVAVRDDGKGISPDDLPHIADPFFSARPAGRSAGLGLAKVKQFARLHGGDLSIVSEPGHGTTATIALPDWRSVSARRSRAAA